MALVLLCKRLLKADRRVVLPGDRMTLYHQLLNGYM